MDQKITKEDTPKVQSSGPRMGRGGPPTAYTGDKAKDIKGTLKKLINYLGSYKVAVLAVIIFAIASTVFTIVGPKILGLATTKIFEGVMAIIANTGGGIDFDYILKIIMILIAFYVVSAFFSFIQGYIMTGVSMKVTYKLRQDVFAKINRLPFKYFDKTSYGEVLSFMTNDIETVNQTLNQSLTQIITSVTTVLGILVMMLSISWQMTLVALLIIPVSMVFISFILKRSQRYFSSQQEYLGHINGHIEENFAGHDIVQAFNHEAETEAVFEGYNDHLYGSAWKSQFLSGLMMPIMNFIGNLGYVGVCILGGALAAAGTISVGDIQAFIQYVRQFTQPMTQIANISNILQMTVAAAERVFTFLEEPEEVEDIEHPLPVDKIQGEVTFDHVSFGYDPEKVIIRDFTASVRDGQKAAIVGPTGAGKTTMIKLLMRFYDVNSGAILIDGHNIKDFRRNDLRSLFGMVLQDTWLYNGTIADNIRYGRLDATDEEVIAAAKAAQVDHFVKTLPEGYNTVLGEDADNISQGQKQLLTIARVILADPEILILDEATSSVDTRTEVLIQKAMDKLMENRTSFIIAHRLSTIQNADNIFVMKDGDIIEQGNHQELLAAQGFYADLYNSQFAEED